MSYQPRISLIIAVKNAKENLLHTLNSIREQIYPYLEVIVIDGGSTDGTVELIDANQNLVTSWLSEPDQGISDAFNKGVRKATGDYINFQGAGDTLCTPDCLQTLFSDLDPSFTLVCGKVARVSEDGLTKLWEAPRHIKPFKTSSLLFKMALPHQGLFTQRTFFDQFGEFDTNVRFAMDYELLLRAYHQFPKTIVKDVLISNWRAGGIGTSKLHEIFDEYHRIKTQHGIASPVVLKAIDRFTRFKYHLKTKWLRVTY
ncbi:MAG: glycosyltransferase family 2 protein [Candidatus Berkiellales bacterium]